MPKAILEFNLPEEKDEYETVMNAGAMAGFVDDWENKLRSMYKYQTHPTENRPLTKTEYTIVMEIRDAYYAMKQDSGII